MKKTLMNILFWIMIIVIMIILTPILMIVIGLPLYYLTEWIDKNNYGNIIIFIMFIGWFMIMTIGGISMIDIHFKLKDRKRSN